ncbi:hypothetical protein BJ742DRAFT_771763 [Cladochytrium replicatum]|nr:hypothetical protein BJ742DRAFT_771763 [Cladochytrium replicatum]
MTTHDDVKNKSDEELKQLDELLTRKLVEATTAVSFRVLEPGDDSGDISRLPLSSRRSEA